MAVTQEQVDDLRADLGDTTGAFSQAELERLLTRSQLTEDSEPRHFVALAYGLLQLINQASRFATYTINEAEERRGEIADNLRENYKLLMGRQDVAEELGESQTAMVTRRFTFTRTRSTTGEYAVPDWY